MGLVKACDVIKNRVIDVRDYDIKVVRRGAVPEDIDMVLRDVELCMCPQAEARLLKLLDRGTKALGK